MTALGGFSLLFCCFGQGLKPGGEQHSCEPRAQPGIECIDLDLYDRQRRLLLDSDLSAFLTGVTEPKSDAVGLCDTLCVAHASEVLLGHLGCASRADYLSRVRAWLTAEPELADQVAKIASCAALRSPGLLVYPLEEAIQLRDGMYSVSLTIRTCLVTGGEGASPPGAARARPALHFSHKLVRLDEQSALRQQELALTTIPAIVTVLLLDGRVVYQNPRSVRYLGSLVGSYVPPRGASLLALGACGHPLVGLFRFDRAAQAAFEEAMANDGEFRRVLKVPRRLTGTASAVAAAWESSGASPRVPSRSRIGRDRTGVSRLMRQASAEPVGGSIRSARSGLASREQSFSRVSPVRGLSGLLSRGPSRKGGIGAAATSRAGSGAFSRRSSMVLPPALALAGRTVGAAATSIGFIQATPLSPSEAVARRLAPPSAGAAASSGKRRNVRRCSSVADMVYGTPSAGSSGSKARSGRQDVGVAGRAGGAAAAAGGALTGPAPQAANDGPGVVVAPADPSPEGLSVQDPSLAALVHGGAHGGGEGAATWTGGLTPLVLLAGNSPQHSSTSVTFLAQVSGVESESRVPSGGGGGSGGGVGVGGGGVGVCGGGVGVGGGGAEAAAGRDLDFSAGSGGGGGACGAMGALQSTGHVVAATHGAAADGRGAAPTPGGGGARHSQASALAVGGSPRVPSRVRQFAAGQWTDRGPGGAAAAARGGGGGGPAGALPGPPEGAPAPQRGASASGPSRFQDLGLLGAPSSATLSRPSRRSGGTSRASDLGAAATGTVTASGTADSTRVTSDCCSVGTPPGSPRSGSCRHPQSPPVRRSSPRTAVPGGDGGAGGVGAVSLAAPDGDGGWAAGGPLSAGQVALDLDVGPDGGDAVRSSSRAGSTPPPHHPHRHGHGERHQRQQQRAQPADAPHAAAPGSNSDGSPFLEQAAVQLPPPNAAGSRIAGSGGGGGASPRRAPWSPGARLATVAGGGGAGDPSGSFLPNHRSGQLLSAIQEEGGGNAYGGGGVGTPAGHRDGLLSLMPLAAAVRWPGGAVAGRLTRISSGDGGHVEIRTSSSSSSGGGGGGAGSGAHDADSFGDAAGGDSSSAGGLASLLLVRASDSGGGPDRRTHGRVPVCLPSLNLGLASGGYDLESTAASSGGGGGGGVASQVFTASGASGGGPGSLLGSSVVFQGFHAASGAVVDAAPLTLRAMVAQLRAESDVPGAADAEAAAAGPVRLAPPLSVPAAPVSAPAPPLAAAPLLTPVWPPDGAARLGGADREDPNSGAAVTPSCCCDAAGAARRPCEPAAMAVAVTSAAEATQGTQPSNPRAAAAAVRQASSPTHPSTSHPDEPAAAMGAARLRRSDDGGGAAAVVTTSTTGTAASAAGAAAAAECTDAALTAPAGFFVPLDPLTLSPHDGAASGDGDEDSPKCSPRRASHPHMRMENQQAAPASPGQLALALTHHTALVNATRRRALGSASARRSRLGMVGDAVSSTSTSTANAVTAASAGAGVSAASASPTAPASAPALRELEQALFSLEHGQVRVRHALAGGSSGGRRPRRQGAQLQLDPGGVSGPGPLPEVPGGGGAGTPRRGQESEEAADVEHVSLATEEIEMLLLGPRGGHAPGAGTGSAAGGGAAAGASLGGAAALPHRLWTVDQLAGARTTTTAAAAGSGSTPAGGSASAAAAAAGGGGELSGCVTKPAGAGNATGVAAVASGPTVVGGPGGSLTGMAGMTGMEAQLFESVVRAASGSVRSGPRRRNTKDRLQSLLTSFTADGTQDEGEAGDEAEWHDVYACVRHEAATGRALVVVTQTVVTEQVEVQRKLEALLEHEHKVLESIFPRHVIEHMTVQSKHRSGAAAGGAGSDVPVVTSHWAQFRGSAMEALATSHRCVTVLFCDIVGFTEMCKQVSAMVVMRFLNTLYMRFDELIDIYGVYKVETIGDCYMVAGGLVRTDGEGNKAVIGDGSEDALHAVRVMSFAKAVMREATEVVLPTTGEPVQLRIGLHSGPVMSGIVGDKMPRFCLFGDTVNTASRMESTCPPGSIHVSADTRALLRNEAWVPSGGVFVKGKGVLETYVWAGHGADEEEEETERRLKVYL